MKPAIGPATMRGRLKRLEKSAYWVAEKRLRVIRKRSTEKAPVPSPEVNFSKLRAPYINS